MYPRDGYFQRRGRQDVRGDDIAKTFPDYEGVPWRFWSSRPKYKSYRRLLCAWKSWKRKIWKYLEHPVWHRSTRVYKARSTAVAELAGLGYRGDVDLFATTLINSRWSTHQLWVDQLTFSEPDILFFILVDRNRLWTSSWRSWIQSRWISSW